jgi:pyruvate dehydrogenase E2 component (dihydrolipoamide acetyltransferase)
MGFHRARSVSAWRKVALGTWGPPRSPTAYGSIDLDCERATSYIEAVRARTGERVTLTHLVGKAAALAIAAAPEVNGFASFGRLMLRETVDIFFQVAFFDDPKPQAAARARSDANLAGAKVSDADKKSVVDIARELREKAAALRSRGQSPTARIASAMKRLPGPLASVAMRAAELAAYDAGINLTPFGIPDDPFGSCMVTNVGIFGIREGHAPLIPYARVPILLTLGMLREAPAVDAGKLVVRRQVTIGVAFDHRVLDGYHAGVMARRFNDAFADPEKMFG